MFTDSTEQRKHPRHKLLNAFAVNQQGVSRIFDISTGGISFGCKNKRDIPDKLVIDIVDDYGLHLLDLSIERVWTAENQDFNTDGIYDTIVGVKFKGDLSMGQRSPLNQLLDFLEQHRS